jgi:hypothetical protein
MNIVKKIFDNKDEFEAAKARLNRLGYKYVTESNENAADRYELMIDSESEINQKLLKKSIEYYKNKNKFLNREGLSSLQPIAFFYEHTLKNILDKNFKNVSKLKGIYGNLWFEVPINYTNSSKVNNIQLSLNESEAVAAYDGQGNVIFRRNKPISNETVLHEFTHPFVDALVSDNKSLFDKLMKDMLSTDDGKIIRDYVVKYYKDKPAIVKKKEILTRAISAVANKNIDEKTGKGLINAVKEFWNWVFNNLNRLFARKAALGQTINVTDLDEYTTINEIANLISLYNGKIDVKLARPKPYIQFDISENVENANDELDSADKLTKKFNPELTEEQKKIKDKIEKTKEISRGKIYMTAEELNTKLKGRNSKNIKQLVRVKDGLTRNVIWDEKAQQEIIVTNRPSDAGQLLFAKSKRFDKERVNAGNNDIENINKRGMGTTLHYVMENIIEELDSQNADFSLLKPDAGKMGNWKDFFDANYESFKQKALAKDSELKKMIVSTDNGTYDYTVDQEALIDPIQDAPQLSDEERTYSIDSRDFKELAKLGFKTYFNIYNTQANMKWDGTQTVGRPVIITEAPVYSSEKDTMGSIDLLVIYDNGKVGHFDWKFMALDSAMRKEKHLPDEVVYQQKLDNSNNRNNWGYVYVPYAVKDKMFIKRGAFEAQVSEYKNILTTSYGINGGDVVQSRVIPVNMVLSDEPTGEKRSFVNEKGETIESDITYKGRSLRFLDHTDELLEELALANELTGDEKLDEFIRNLYKERDILKFRLSKDKDNQSIRSQLENIEKNITAISVKRDINYVATQIIELAKIVSDNIGQEKFIYSTDNKSKTINPKYITDQDLNNFEDVLKLYSDLMRSSENILSIEENKGNIEKVNQLKDVLIKQQRVTVNILGLIAKERNQRFMEAAKEGAYETDNEKYEVNITPDSLKRAGVNVSDKTGKYTDINMLQQNFASLSKLNHPHLRMYKDLIDSMNANVKFYMDEVDARIKKVSDKLKEWGKNKGLSTSEVYGYLIDKSTGHLVTKYKQSLMEEVKNARKEKNIEWLKENIIFDREKFMQTRNKMENIYRKIYANESDITEKLTQFDEANDMELSNYAYYNPRNKNWKFKDELAAEHINPRWEYIQNTEPLKAFYDEHKAIIKEIRENLLGGNSKVSDEFVAHVEKDTIDSIVENGALSMDNLSNLKAMVQKAFAIRENDEDFGYTIDGQVVDDVPLLYVDGVPGGIINKSKDLAKSLMIFAYASKLHHDSKNLEGISNAIRRSLVATKLLVKDQSGNIIPDKVLDNTEESKLVKTLDGFIKLYIYGQKIQSGEDIIGGKKASKILSDVMNLHSKANLALNHLSLIGGHLNAKAQMIAEAQKGKHFTKKQWREAELIFSGFNPKSALALEFFEVSNEGNSGLVYERGNKLSISSLRAKYNKSAAFYFQRMSDDKIDSVYLVAMMKNYVLHPNGVDIFPISEANTYLKGTEWEGENMLTMWDSMTVIDNPEDGQLPFELPLGDGNNTITRKQFIKFRNRVKALAAKSKGNYSPEDSYLYKTNMMIKPLMQYRGWIPEFCC